jgi:hypothetical protein
VKVVPNPVDEVLIEVIVGRYESISVSLVILVKLGKDVIQLIFLRVPNSMHSRSEFPEQLIVLKRTSTQEAWQPRT